MNEHDLFQAISGIDDDILEKSETYHPRQKTSFRFAWWAAAACLCLVAAAALPWLFGPGPAALPDTSVSVPQKTSPATPPRSDTSVFTDESTTPSDSHIQLPTSDTYTTLPELLEHLSRHDSHDDRKADAANGGSGAAARQSTGGQESLTLTESTGAAVSIFGDYAYHIMDQTVAISRLDGANTVRIGTLEETAADIFISNDHLLLVSQICTGGDELDPELSAQIRIYDISSPETPVLLDTYTQRGELTACWMVGADLYVVTGDGVCACGWSRLDDVSGYQPALTHNGDTVPWADSEISILGEPTRVQYSAVSVVNGNTCELVRKEALYGNILKLFYGTDWLAAVTAASSAAYRENPVVYTFDGHLDFTGKIDPAQITGASAENPLKDYVPQDGTYLSLVYVSKEGGFFRMLGTCTEQEGDSKAQSFLALSASPTGKEALFQRLPWGEDYPHGSFTEIIWEEDRAIACIGTMEGLPGAHPVRETRFLFAEFSEQEIRFRECDLRAAYLDGRVGTAYGNPIDHFRTMIPLGDGLYLRYTDAGEGPGGFELYDFSDSASPRLLFRPEQTLSGDGAFDYIWHVSGNTVGTLKITLGEETDYFRDVTLSWCEFTADPGQANAVALLRETPLDEQVKTFFGGDELGCTVFEAAGQLYYVSRICETPFCLTQGE